MLRRKLLPVSYACAPTQPDGEGASGSVEDVRHGSWRDRGVHLSSRRSSILPLVDLSHSSKRVKLLCACRVLSQYCDRGGWTLTVRAIRVACLGNRCIGGFLLALPT
eukprot:6174172-Pleurochrysis_carterae.AAC.2